MHSDKLVTATSKLARSPAGSWAAQIGGSGSPSGKVQDSDGRAVGYSSETKSLQMSVRQTPRPPLLLDRFTGYRLKGRKVLPPRCTAHSPVQTT